ncbi:MAG: type II toxin-antitoxin system VapC family toxin [Actinobacteria bacterium]|nr:type II toxin-antitoxin system VapC family toxin [Actinomycetota bacterium]
MPSLTTTPRHVPEPRVPRGVLDTSVVIDLEHVAADDLPAELAVSAITLAELAAGPHAASDPDERARRQDRLQRAEATFEPLPVDANVARAYGRIYAAVTGAGGKARGARSLDLLIAATALASNLPLYTRNPDDFTDIASFLEVVAISAAG